MKVECLTNNVGDLPDAEREHVLQSIHAKEVNLARGREYVVYGVIFRAGFPWYLLCEDNDATYPVPHYAGFFQLTENTIPSGWSFQWRNGPWPDGVSMPTEWCKPGFIEALIDGDSDEIEIFKHTKARIDSEGQGDRR